MSAQAIHDLLNRQIASWGVLYIKLHNYHWYVSGPQFFTLHAKFQELYEEAAQHVDTLAERLLALRGKPLARMSDYAAHSLVKDADGDETAEQMVEALIVDYTLLIHELKQGITLAQQAGDETTGDMLLAIHTELEKHVWMLGAWSGRQV
ncbi:DNA starvation/stationary phase protection protein [Paenibacillus sp. IB182496]|uniref:DNA starvation/stationary phase protection protein n=1 Tax=Paenibacillus sabuli TaxID=2772509 RepID=A0A927BVZ0_9BACL|nr:Dps family protein [Paenibacillus sabuli]MBD2847857.1 DNA starvation/stationary phase protection protein [Paenibacillus sabuli]